MNQTLTLSFLIAAGIGLVVQNTLMVRITQTSSTILIAMLLNSLVGIVLFVSILWFKQGMAGFGELVSSVRWWTLIRLAGIVLCFCQHQWIPKCGCSNHYRGAGGQPVNRRTGAGYSAQSWRAAAGVGGAGLRRGAAGRWGLAGGKTFVLIALIRPEHAGRIRCYFAIWPQRIKGLCRLWSTVRDGFPYPLYADGHDVR